jgi:hypothetical protein
VNQKSIEAIVTSILVDKGLIAKEDLTSEELKYLPSKYKDTLSESLMIE